MSLPLFIVLKKRQKTNEYIAQGRAREIEKKRTEIEITFRVCKRHIMHMGI
jgi:hypothetical protein